jgi:dienelactone hydrolase
MMKLTPCLALSLLLAGPALAQQFEVQPPSADVVAGEPLQIRLAGLPPKADVMLITQRAVTEFFGGRRLYAASAHYTAGADGTLDLATAVPRPGGSYQGADLRGLFWSMAPQARGDAAALTDGEVRLEARIGEQTVARQTLRLRGEAATLQWRDATPFPGAKLAWLPGSAKRPAIIALGGSEGGSAIVHSAGLLASHGFAVLGLPYYSPGGFSATGPTPPELPTLPAAFADIPVERLEQARAWLAQQPEVDASRIAVYGVSKGAEFALIASTKMPWLKSVVAIVPSDVVWEGWGPGVEPGKRSSYAWKGTPLAFVPYVDFDKEFMGFQTGQPIIIRRPQDKGRAANPDRVPAARIPVETYAGPMMIVGSHGDQVWDSGGMAENINRSRAAAGRETVALIYRDAGHALSGTGWSPTTQYNAGPMKMGGTAEADAHAQAEAFQQTLQFLKRTLAP